MDSGLPEVGSTAVAGSPAPQPGGGPGAGNGGPPPVPLPPPRQGPGLRPALVVVGVAAAVIIVFGVLAAVTSGGTGPGAPSAPASGAPTPVAGTTLRAVPAAAGLRAIEQPGTPPPDILGTLTLPAGARPVSATPSTGAGQYNANVRFAVPVPEATVIAFYRTELASGGWKVFSVGPAAGGGGGTEVLAQKAGSDGWYWEAGAVVSPTTFSGAGGVHQQTRFSLNLFQVPDAA